MKYLKYAGICAAGFFTEYFLSAVIAAFLVFPPLYVIGVLPCCILAGKIHCFYTSRISNFLRAPLAAYCITALGLPILLGAAGAFTSVAIPELITPRVPGSAWYPDAFAALLFFGGILLNTLIISLSGARHIYKERMKGSMQ